MALSCDVREAACTIIVQMFNKTMKTNEIGPVRESNPGPLAPEARIIPLDQQANAYDLYLMADIWNKTTCLVSNSISEISFGKYPF